MTWETMSPEQRNVLIAEKIMGYETGEMPSGTLMMWNKSGLVEPIPRYTQSMDAAWLVLQKIAARYDKQAEDLDEVFDEFKSRLFDETGDEIYPATWLLLDMAKWTPDHICKVALEAVEADKK